MAAASLCGGFQAAGCPPWEQGQLRDTAPEDRAALQAAVLCTVPRQSAALSRRLPKAAQASREEARRGFRCRRARAAAAPHAPTTAHRLLPRRCPGPGPALRLYGGRQSPVTLGDRALPSLRAARDVSSVLCSAASPRSTRCRGGRDGARAGRPETAAAAAEITKMGLNVSGRRCRPGGRYLRLAAGREPRGHLPNHRPRSRPGRAAPSRPSPRQMPRGRLTWRSRDASNRCISNRPFVPEP